MATTLAGGPPSATQDTPQQEASAALPFAVRAAHSDNHFVGLLASANGSPPTLQLPIGYAAPAHQDLAAARKAFRLVFQVCRAFAANEAQLKAAKDVAQLGLRSAPPKDREGARQAESTDDIYGALSWQRLEIFEQLVSRMRQPEVLMAEVRQAWREGFDARQLHRMWPRALYCDDVPVFDSHPGRRHEMRESTSHGLLGLAAWLAVDYLQTLQADDALQALGNAAPTVQLLAQEFAGEQGLANEDTLWSAAHTSQSTRSRLNNVLADLLKRHPQRSAPLQEIAEQIDLALNTRTVLQGGLLWGVKGFADVWEALCLAWALQPGAGLPEPILTLDDGHLHGGPWAQATAWAELQGQVFNKNHKARRPDLVLGDLAQGTARITHLVDFKYYSASDCRRAFLGKRYLLTYRDASGEPKKDWEQWIKPKEDIDSLEAYRLLAAVHHMKHGIEATAESIPIAIWAPASEAFSNKGEALPALQLVYLDTQVLMENYLAFLQARSAGQSPRALR